jgi:long-chain acyl-CoA synthetase
MSLTLSHALRHAEQLFGPREAVVCSQTRLSFDTFAERCRRLAAGLTRLGVEPGDRVAVLMQNCHRYLEAYTAVPAAGAIIVPLNTRHEISEQAVILDDCRPRLLIVDDANEDIAGRLTGRVPTVIHTPTDYEPLLEQGSPSDLTFPIDEQDPAAIFYTGGTSGAPKGVVLSHRNLVTNAYNMIIGAGYDENDRFLHVAPMFHLADGSSIYALTWRGARHVILPRFDPAQVLKTIEQERITCVIMVPTMIHALINHPDIETRDLRSLRLVLHGGAPITTSLLRQAVERLDCSFTQAYGITEGSSHIALLPHEERLLDDRRVRSVGRARMGVEIKVRREDGSSCEPGEVGEVTARGPNMTCGYWNRPEETAAVLKNGWFRTGDLGYLDAEGYIYLVDRAKDMVISGGENVYCIEVEETLSAHPALQAAAVIGVPDPVWGERVHAVIVLHPDQQVDADTLREFCRQRIAGYKCPRSIEIVDALPLSGAGKVLKRVLRERYQATLQREEE